MLLVLTMTACSREKEPAAIPDHTVNYVVSNAAEPFTSTTAAIYSDEELQSLFNQFCDMAEQGRIVAFHSHHRNQDATKRATASKDATSLITTSRNEMMQWMSNIDAMSMTAMLLYDADSNQWTGTVYTADTAVVAEDTYRLESATFDRFTSNDYWVHKEYRYLWDGDRLASVLMVDNTHNVYYHNMQLVDTIFTVNKVAILSYDGDRCNSIKVYNTDNGSVEYEHRLAYLDRRLVQEWSSTYNRTYIYRYNEQGFIDDWLIADAYSTYPMGLHLVWRDGDMIQQVKDDGTVLYTYEYDDTPCFHNLSFGRANLLPGFTGHIPPEPQWSSHNMVHHFLNLAKSQSTDLRMEYAYEGDKVVALIARWNDQPECRWNFTYSE